MPTTLAARLPTGRTGRVLAAATVTAGLLLGGSAAAQAESPARVAKDYVDCDHLKYVVKDYRDHEKFYGEKADEYQERRDLYRSLAQEADDREERQYYRALRQEYREKMRTYRDKAEEYQQMRRDAQDTYQEECGKKA